MSQYQWVIESPEDADGVSTTILLGFDGSDSDDNGVRSRSGTASANRRGGRPRHGGPSSSSGAQEQWFQDEDHLVWWTNNNHSVSSGTHANNNNATSSGGSGVRGPRSEGGSSRRSKASSNRRSRRGGPGSSAGVSSSGTGAGFGQHNGNGRRGSHRGTPIFTSTYFPDSGLEANDEEARSHTDGAPPLSSAYRAALAPQPHSARTAGSGGRASSGSGYGGGGGTSTHGSVATHTSGSSRSSGGTCVHAWAAGSSDAENAARVVMTNGENTYNRVGDASAMRAGSRVWPDRHAPSMFAAGQAPTPHPHQQPQAYTATLNSGSLSDSSAKPHNKKLQKKLSHQPALATTAVAEASHAGTGGARARRFRSSRMVPTTITTFCFADEDTSLSDSSSESDDDHTTTTHVIIHEADDADTLDSCDARRSRRRTTAANRCRHPREHRTADARRWEGEPGDADEEPEAQFAFRVASLAAQAHGLRHHLAPLHTPPLAPAKPPAMAAPDHKPHSRRQSDAPPFTLNATASASSVAAAPSAAARSALPPSLFSSQRPQPRASEGPFNPVQSVSSYYISPIHQSVAQESSDFSGTPYFFLGEGGGLGPSGRPASSTPALSRKEQREREAALEAECGLDASAFTTCGGQDRSPSGSGTRDDEAYDSSVEDMRFLDGHATRRRWQLAPQTGVHPRLPGSSRGDGNDVVATRKRGRGGKQCGRGDDDGASGDNGGLRTSSDEDEADEIMRRVKRRRLQLVGSEECGGSKVLGPLAAPVTLPPDMSLTLPSTRAETREDLLKSFFMGQALHEDDFRLY